MIKMEENKNEEVKKTKEKEERKVVKIRLSTAILCFIILALVLGLVFMYLYYNKKDDTNNSTVVAQNTTATTTTTTSTSSVAENKVENTVVNKTPSTIENNTSNNSSSTSTKETLDVNSELVKKLYNYIPAFDQNRIQNNAYQTKKVTKETLDNKVLLAYAFKNLKLNESDKTTVVENGNPIEGWYTFDAEKLHEKEIEMYGSAVRDDSFEIGYGQGCTYSNGKYSFSSGGGSDEWMVNVRTITKANKENDMLYIEDKYIVSKEKENKLALYTASDSNEKLVVMDGSNYTDDDTLRKEIKNKYENKMTTYKHTFKKNADGSYYWYSTEPVE